MDEKELLKFLKENITIDVEQETEAYSQTESVTISLKIGDEVVSSGWITLDRGDPEQV